MSAKIKCFAHEATLKHILSKLNAFLTHLSLLVLYISQSSPAPYARCGNVVHLIATGFGRPSFCSRQLYGLEQGLPALGKAEGRLRRLYWPAPRDIGRSDLPKSAAASPVDEMSSAPVAARTSFAFLVHSLLSQWMESKMPPDLIRPS
jgi:hypothetical protein